MSEDTKLIQVVVVDGEPAQLKALQDQLNIIKKKLSFDAEFLITNDKIKFQDVRVMIKELYALYQLGQKELPEKEKKE